MVHFENTIFNIPIKMQFVVINWLPSLRIDHCLYRIKHAHLGLQSSIFTIYHSYDNLQIWESKNYTLSCLLTKSLLYKWARLLYYTNGPELRPWWAVNTIILHKTNICYQRNQVLLTDDNWYLTMYYDCRTFSVFISIAYLVF